MRCQQQHTGKTGFIWALGGSWGALARAWQARAEMSKNHEQGSEMKIGRRRLGSYNID